MRTNHQTLAGTITGVLSAPVGAFAGWVLAALAILPAEVALTGTGDLGVAWGLAIYGAGQAATASFIYAVFPGSLVLFALRWLKWSNAATCTVTGAVIAATIATGGFGVIVVTIIAGAMSGYTAWLGSGKVGVSGWSDDSQRGVNAELWA